MNCPQCGKPTKESTLPASIIIDGVVWGYSYREFVCDRHAPVQFQTEEQMQANLDAINAVKRSAEKLKKNELVKDKQKTVKQLKAVAWATLCAFGIVADLNGECLDSNMSIVCTKAAMIELSYGEDCDTELVMRLFIQAAKFGVKPRKDFSPGGYKQADSLANMNPGEFVIAKPNFKK